MNMQLPSAAQAKDQAKRLRTKMAEDGASIGHTKFLELVAHQHGFRDWNTMFAAIGNGPPKGWAFDVDLCLGWAGSYSCLRFIQHAVSFGKPVGRFSLCGGRVG